MYSILSAMLIYFHHSVTSSVIRTMQTLHVPYQTLHSLPVRSHLCMYMYMLYMYTVLASFPGSLPSYVRKKAEQRAWERGYTVPATVHTFLCTYTRYSTHLYELRSCINAWYRDIVFSITKINTLQIRYMTKPLNFVNSKKKST